MKQVAVLGCGPAGMLAAHAVALQGMDPVIYSLKQKSIMPGAQYLHNAIPDLTPSKPDGIISFQKIGTKEGYAAKVYGNPSASCSWDSFPAGQVPAWHMGSMYDELWNMYSPNIIDMTVAPRDVRDISANFPLVLSAVPLKAICESGHEFLSKSVWIRTSSEMPGSLDSRIVYNGDPKIAWYRFSRLWGHNAWEFGHRVGNANEGVKPLMNNCTCHPKVVRLGRFGKWAKGVLVTDAFQEARNAVQPL